MTLWTFQYNFSKTFAYKLRLPIHFKSICHSQSFYLINHITNHYARFSKATSLKSCNRSLHPPRFPKSGPRAREDPSALQQWQRSLTALLPLARNRSATIRDNCLFRQATRRAFTFESRPFNEKEASRTMRLRACALHYTNFSPNFYEAPPAASRQI